ncbi:fimbrial protein [Klebsiella pneumoniae]|uniref:fimbrial protein n=1 Tax=Klebsiella pneumoniae TaxID=573 RepID=UPI0030A19D76
MRNYFLAISTAFAAIYSPSIFAASGCVVIDGKTYELNLASMPIDPDVDVGTVLYTARVDTSGPKLTCPLNTARGKYSSQMLGSFQTLVGTNAYGNIYASGIDGIGIQIRDLEQSAKAVSYETSMDSGALYYWSTDKKTQIQFIKTGKIGTGTSYTGLAAQFKLDSWVVAKISIKTKVAWITKSCVAEPNSRIQNIQLGKPLASSFTSIGSTSPDVNFSVKLKCQEDNIPVYVSFEPSTGSTGNGMLNLDTSNADAASGIAIEILNAADRSKLVFSSEKKYHTASESSIEIPLIAHYKRTGTVKAGTANAAMTFVINQY